MGLQNPPSNIPGPLTVGSATGIDKRTAGLLGTAVAGTDYVAATGYTDGQLLIGDTSTGGLDKATLTQGANITITNGHGTITIAATTGGGVPGGSTGQIQYDNAGAFGGAALVVYATSGHILISSAGAVGDVPLTARGFAGQTGNLQEWQNSAATALAFVDASGNLNSPKLTTATTALVLEQTGDSLGTTRLTLENRVGLNGALFENTTLGLVDFGFKALAAQGNFRFETRGGANDIIASPEFQVFPTALNPVPTFVVSGQANTACLCADRVTGHAQTWLNYTDVSGGPKTQAKVAAGWATATDASRKGKLTFSPIDATATRESLRVESDGTYGLTIVGGGATVAGTSCLVYAQAAGNKGLAIQAAASQTGDLVEVQSSAGNPLYSFDKLGRPVTANTTPTIAAGTGAGTAPTVSVAGTDVNGVITITTGTGPSASAVVATVSFSAAYAAAPKTVNLQASGATAAALSGTGGVFVDDSTTTTTGFSLTVGAAALAPSTTYKFKYHTVG